MSNGMISEVFCRSESYWLVLMTLKLLVIYLFVCLIILFGGSGEELICSNLERPRFTKFHPCIICLCICWVSKNPVTCGPFIS